LPVLVKIEGSAASQGLLLEAVTLENQDGHKARATLSCSTGFMEG